MEVRVEQLGDAQVRLTISISACEFRRAFRRTRGHLQQGRKPRTRAALDRNGRRWFEEALRRAHLWSVGQPTRVVFEQRPDDGPTLLIDTFVLPPATSTCYKGVRVEMPRITDLQVEIQMGQARDEVVEYPLVDRPVEDGDFVTVSYTGVIGDQPAAERRGVRVPIADSELAPGFPQALIGARRGEVRRVDMELHGQPSSLDVAIDEVAVRRYHEFDDALAERLGYADYAAMWDGIRADAIAAALRSAALEAVEAEVNLPPALIQRAVGQQPPVEQQEEEAAKHPFQRALDELRERAVIAAIVEAEGIEVTDDEVAERRTEHSDEQELRWSEARRKAADVVVAHATIAEAGP